MENLAVSLLLLALLCAGALSTPLRTAAPPGSSAEMCTKPARALLVRLRSVLEAALEERTSSELFHGFNCTELRATVNPNSHTVSLCQPNQNVTCSSQSSHSFRETECLKHIRGDLLYYQLMLKDYVQSLDHKQKTKTISDLTSITDSIQTLQENCPLLMKTEVKPTVTVWKSTKQAFDDRMDLCKQLKGFHIRTVTINRALSYISAGEYRK